MERDSWQTRVKEEEEEGSVGGCMVGCVQTNFTIEGNLILGNALLEIDLKGKKEPRRDFIWSSVASFRVPDDDDEIMFCQHVFPSGQ